MKIQDKEIEFILLKDGFITSIITDIVTFGLMMFMFWFNHRFVGDSMFMNVIIVIMIIIFLNVELSDRYLMFRTKDELINYLNGKKHEELQRDTTKS